MIVAASSIALFSSLLLLPSSLIPASLANQPQARPYLMYVWRQGYRPTNILPSGLPCGDLMGANENMTTCWEPNWEGSWKNRADLYAATTRPGRNIGMLLVGSVWDRFQELEQAGWPRNEAGHCDDDIHWLLQLNHWHATRVYALVGISAETFSERERIPLAKAYNDYCSDGIPSHQFDGVAVNNEYFTDVKCNYQETSSTEELDWLHKLKEAADLASPLPLHMSVAWHWSKCINSTTGESYENLLPWSPNPGVFENVESKRALQHIYDVVSSVDIQIASTDPGTVIDRIDEADYGYHQKFHPTKELFTLAYANDPVTDEPCTPTHFYIEGGDPDCTSPRGEVGIWSKLEVVEALRPHAKGGIHAYRNAYNTGILPDWPYITLGFSFSYLEGILAAMTIVDVESALSKKDFGRLERMLQGVGEDLNRLAGTSTTRKNYCATVQKVLDNINFLKNELMQLGAYDAPVLDELLHPERGVPALQTQTCL